MPKQLLILPFDHRSSFARDILGVKDKPNQSQKKEISLLKDIIFEGFLLSWQKMKNKNDFAILVDEQYGTKVIKRAKELGVKICLPTEKSGQNKLKLEYGWFFRSHINRFKPNYVKTLIRYNPANKEINLQQLKTLNKLSNYCRKKNYTFILELLVPPTKKEITKGQGFYDNNIRPALTAQAIRELKKSAEVNIWKLEGMAEKNWQKIINQLNKNEKIIILGRGEDKNQVDNWLKTAKKYKEIIGFAVGRTIFLQPLKDYHNGKISQAKCIKQISINFDYFVDLWQDTKKS